MVSIGAEDNIPELPKNNLTERERERGSKKMGQGREEHIGRSFSPTDFGAHVPVLPMLDV